MTDQPTPPLHEQVRTLEADLVMCREQLAQETERAEKAERQRSVWYSFHGAAIAREEGLRRRQAAQPLPTPDPTNPAHLRWAARMIDAHREMPRGTVSTPAAEMLHTADHLEAAQQQADADEELIEKAAQVIFSSGGISNGQLLAMDSDRRAEVIASLSLEVRRNLAHIAILGASRLIKESVCDDSQHKAKRADEFAELAANLLRDGGEK